ncbi:MAG TPA: YihY family inner membrane protein [Legionella sp.]|nr:YihY family inner membrane protein [Legionella sp.]
MNWKVRIINKFYSAERFVRFVIQHFIQDECTYIASALAFTTLLAVVPLMSVGLSIFSSFPVFQGFSDPVQNFIFENFVPSTGKVVQSYLQQFTAQVSKLSIWGVAFLIVTAILVMVTVERAMNKIWRVNSSRQGVAAFLLYWAILSLTPVMLGLSLAASSYLFSMPLLVEHHGPSFLFKYIPFFLSLLGFISLYIIVPNCPVKFRHAFWGGLFAALLFETAKAAFAYYLNRYNTYELLYGAFASVPIFFVWIYWLWIITLLGAEISYALSVHHQRRRGQTLDGFSHALLWLHQLWLVQQHGKGLTFNELIDASNQPFAVDADEMINALIHNELIHATADGRYMLSRDLSQITLYSLTQLLPYRLPTHLELQYSKSSLSEQWRAAFKKNDAELKKSLDITLEELFQKK